MKSSFTWRFVFGVMFLVGIFFVWGNEVWDLPHLLLNAPGTPVNVPESVFETIFFTLFGSIVYHLIVSYEKKWKNALVEMQELATFDPLTGVLNRRIFTERALAEFSRSVRSGIPFILTIIDIDNFKGVNDRYGHLCGDKVLVGFVDAIKRHVRPHDLVGRLGGDEFWVLLVDANGDGNSLQQRVLEDWNNVQILSDDGQQITTGISMGGTAWKAADAYLEDVIRRADKLLYQAKNSGRNCIVTG